MDGHVPCGRMDETIPSRVTAVGVGTGVGVGVDVGGGVVGVGVGAGVGAGAGAVVAPNVMCEALNNDELVLDRVPLKWIEAPARRFAHVPPSY